MTLVTGRVRQMLRCVERGGDLSLADLAYTLQVGREAMAFRLAMVVHDLDELARGLRYYLAQMQEPRTVTEAGWLIPMFTGNLDEERSDMGLLLAGSSGEALLRLLLAEHNFEKLALYWAKGGTIPWAVLHEDGAFRLLSLPTYPFARERYWVPASALHQPGAEQGSRAGDEPPSRVAAEHGSEPHDAAVVAAGDGEFTVHPEHGVRANMQRYMVWFLCQETGLTPDQVKPGKGCGVTAWILSLAPGSGVALRSFSRSG